MAKKSESSPDIRWSGKVTKESNALDLEEGAFTWKDPKKIALSLKQSADSSTRRKAPPFRSAMSMLVFYINRQVKTLKRTSWVFWRRPRKNCASSMARIGISDCRISFD